MTRNDYEEYVRGIYPDMIVDFWYSFGELLFYKDDEAEEPYSCIYKNGRFDIVEEF